MTVAALTLGLPAVPATAAAGATMEAGPDTQPVAAPGKPWQLPEQRAANRNLATLGNRGAASEGAAGIAAITAALARAKATRKPVPITGLTTATTTVAAEPDGTEQATDYVLPVRVRSGSTWVPVDTSLRQIAGGRLGPAEVPGATVTFSGGGTGPMAVISASGTSLALSWPDALPVPVVAGASATYKNVLPGVDLVLTATSAQSGGFSETLVVTTAAAARDPGLPGLSLRVAVSGTTGLRTVSGGGLTAVMTRGRGSFVAPPALMWDSSTVLPGTVGARSAAVAARAVGGGLAVAGSGPRSTVTSPAGGARLAGVGARVSLNGTELSLAPDLRMLTSPTTKFPVYIDPSFTTITGTGGRQAYDPVQSDCPSPHYDSSSYPAVPVGYDNFQAGNCQDNDTDYALYVVAIPSGTFGSHSVLISASFQAAEVYSSDCTSSVPVTVSWIGTISKSTGWPGPAPVGGNVNAVTTVPPDAGPNSSDPEQDGSCNTVEDTSVTKAAGFDLKPDLAKISSASAITLRMWEPGNTAEDDHKQFTDNPDLQVVYTETPDTPSDLGQAANNSGTIRGQDCDSSPSNPPRIGKTDSTNGPYLLADYSDPDGASVQANIRYWDYSTSSAVTTKNAAVNDVIGQAVWQMPASYTSGLPDGSVIAWQAQAETGSGSVGGATYGPYSSPWSAACYFAVYPSDPDAPTVTADFTQGDAQPVGSPVSFTITQSAADTASEFIWAVDQTPPTIGTVYGSQTCTSTAAEARCTQISGGSATLTIPVTGPGPHDLWVYEVDAGGNDSGMTNGAAAGSASTFTGAGDPNVAYTSGSGLQANFADALGAKQPFDNTMISTQAGESGAANGDGGAKSLDEAQLSAAGWEAGKAVTVDGATFSLPDFGPSGSGPDNVLAANQTIGTGSLGAQGSALVFLATSTLGDVQVSGVATGSQDSGVLDGDPTAPAVAGGTPITGADCDGTPAFNTSVPCAPATGTINYASGCPVSQAPYTLTVPDWVEGPSDLAALVLPDWDTSTGQQAQSVKIYVFAVPLNSACMVTSVTLPDVAASVNGVTTIQPALHIFGMAVRNTTTATPEVNGTAAAVTSGQAWTGAFESPIEDAYAAGSSWTGNQTFRLLVSPDIGASAGADVRIKLADPGFLSGDGTGPLVIGAATIADRYYAAVPAQTPVPLTFGGSASVTVPEGGDVYSDPLTLPFAVTPGTGLLISIWIENSSLAVLPLNSWASGGLTWVGPAATPNETEDTSGTPFTGPGSDELGAVPLLTAVDVTTPAESSAAYATSSPGAPTVVVAGNNVIDGFSSSAESDASDMPSQRVAGQLSGLLPSLAGTYATSGLASYGVVDAGVQSNQVLADGTSGGGVSLLARVDADILAEPDVGTVVLNEGLEDVLQQAGSVTGATSLEYAYTLLDDQLAAFGINVITGDLTPCSGYSNSTVGDSCTSAVDGARIDVNSFIEGNSPACPAGFDAAVSNEASTEALAPGYGTDGANLTLGTSGGYAQLANAVLAPSTDCQLMPNIPPGS